jgi:hypothetical protein
MDHTARSLKSSSHQTAADAPVWAFLVIRRSRDRASLNAELAAGDPLARRIIWAIGDWLRHWRHSTAARAPICLICESQFRRPKSAPGDFFIATTDDARVRQNIVISGICRRCATKTDAELMMGAAAEVCADGHGQILGFGTVGGGTPSNIH